MKHHHLIAFGGCIARRRCPDPTSYGGRHHQARVTPPEHQQHLMCASPSDSSDNSACDRSVDQRLCELMSPSPGVKPEQMNTSSLAYIGDVVFELFVRSRYVWPNRRMSDLQNKVVSVVRGENRLPVEFVRQQTLKSLRVLVAEAQAVIFQK